MRLSQKYADHRAELQSIATYLIESATDTPTPRAIVLGITQADVEEIDGVHSDFSTAYAAYIDPTKHTTIVVQDMKIKDDKAYAVILPLRQRLKKGAVELTPDDYVNLGIHEDKATNTPAEIPVDVPTPFIVERKSMLLTFEATMETTEAVNRVALPLYYRIAREMAVVAQGVEPTEADFHSLDSVGHSRFSIVYSAAEVGMNAFVRIAYENAAGRGAFSAAVKGVIS